MRRQGTKRFLGREGNGKDIFTIALSAPTVRYMKKTHLSKSWLALAWFCAGRKVVCEETMQTGDIIVYVTLTTLVMTNECAVSVCVCRVSTFEIEI